MSTSPWQPLAQQILAIVDPLVEAATKAAASLPDAKPARCEQVWCPACATVAIATGEHHPLKAVVAEHGAALLAVLRTVATASDTQVAESPDTTGTQGGTTQPEPGPGHYQPITVTIDDGAPSPGGSE
ncbi:MAG: hypothetical protein M3O32_06000 [Actinomycetota bacterium]|nr:hypothetical protein [Actinomycetota bacterium]